MTGLDLGSSPSSAFDDDQPPAAAVAAELDALAAAGAVEVVVRPMAAEHAEATPRARDRR